MGGCVCTCNYTWLFITASLIAIAYSLWSTWNALRTNTQTLFMVFMSVEFNNWTHLSQSENLGGLVVSLRYLERNC